LIGIVRYQHAIPVKQYQHHDQRRKQFLGRYKTAPPNAERTTFDSALYRGTDGQAYVGV
jgi:hypothetical protein